MVLPPAAPSTLQFTVVFDVPVTVAVNCCVAPVRIVAEVGETETATEGAVIVTMAAPDSLGFPVTAADTVTGFEFGTVAGAV